ncbi:hypothetical protein [Laceyella tengchongensis]|jgi:hypothetical protein|uniref:hypothetical protein n=1 Tax=Laceyella tengchongensis TaxID=574699 RepID=UPI0012B810E2|nr:hypothetical protein [Laceyella tengchongensis]
MDSEQKVLPVKRLRDDVLSVLLSMRRRQTPVAGNALARFSHLCDDARGDCLLSWWRFVE